MVGLALVGLTAASMNPSEYRAGITEKRLASWNNALFQDASRFSVIPALYSDGFMDAAVRPTSANPTMQGVIAVIALAANVICLAAIIKRAKQQKKNPYKNEIFTDQKDYKEAMARAEV